jgi:hypothetical protein
MLAAAAAVSAVPAVSARAQAAVSGQIALVERQGA